MSGAAKVLLGLTPVLGATMIGAAGVLDGAGSYRDAKNQAGAYEAYAKNARQQAKNQADQEREKYRKLGSSRRAAMGASGLDVNDGSSLDALADIDAEGEVSARLLLHGGEAESANWRQRAESAKAGGRSALGQGLGLGTATGILGIKNIDSRYWGLLGL